jgi:hypothetical protein
LNGEIKNNKTFIKGLRTKIRNHKNKNKIENTTACEKIAHVEFFNV